MNVERLQKLADFLPNVDPKRFNMNRWADGKLAKDCGTVGCAFGWATTIFKELKLIKSGHTSHMVEFFNGDDGTYYGFDAAQQFFEISYDDALELFSDDRYLIRPITTVMVVDKIEEFIKDHP